MVNFETKSLPSEADAVAPDGSDVRVLLGLIGGSLAHFELSPGDTSLAVQHTKRSRKSGSSLRAMAKCGAAKGIESKLYQSDQAPASPSRSTRSSNSDLSALNHFRQSVSRCRRGQGVERRYWLRAFGPPR
jgi:hypothetical protein